MQVPTSLLGEIAPAHFHPVDAVHASWIAFTRTHFFVIIDTVFLLDAGYIGDARFVDHGKLVCELLFAVPSRDFSES